MTETTAGLAQSPTDAETHSDATHDGVAAAAASAPAPLTAKLLVRSVNIVADPLNRSPMGKPVEIVEVELGLLLNDGNGPWVQGRDLLRLTCERGKGAEIADALKVALKLGA